MALFAGTSGWQYRHWKGSFYPEDLPTTKWLPYYAERFPTVEVNNTFYRLPERKTFESWRKATPDDFVITVKASRFLTHNKRLLDPEPAVRKLIDAAQGLERKLGPILLQLSPKFAAAPERLEQTLAAFPREQKVAVEFRHDSWFGPEVREILERFNAALCLVDRDGKTLGPVWKTASWGYLRFHNGDSEWWRYSQGRLEHWVHALKQNFDASDDVFAYFNNDMGTAAIYDCREFERLALNNGLLPSRMGAAR
jgi:uncharacterized protein YecE (DUF72 family)